MYRQTKPHRTTLSKNTSYQGETLEKKINRIVNNKEPIKDGAPIIYTERKDGVMPQYDIRTDRFEIALDATDKIAKAHLAKRDDRQVKKTVGEEAKENMKIEDQSIQATKKE